MYKQAWILLHSAVVLKYTESLSKTYSEKQRSFEFPDNPQPQPQDPNDSLFAIEGRQGTTLPGFPTLGPTGPTLPTLPPTALASTIPIATPVNPLITNIVTPTVGQTCICVPTGSCNTSVPGNPDGSGLIDIRIVTSNVSPVIVNPTTSTVTSCGANLVLCCQPGPYQCGVRYPPILGAPLPVPGSGQAAYGAYPWQAVLLAPGDVYLGSGVLLNNLNVLTVAHRASPYVNAPATLKVRMGEWNAGGATEVIPAQEFIVSRVTLHPNYNAANLKNDIAVLRLATAVPLGNTPTIATGCLPATSFAGTRCFVSGWGRNDFASGTFQNIQKEVDVPILQSAACQTSLAATRLGPTFVFDPVSFLCAGGEPGKDACTGDGGSPLVCSISNRWFVAGLVAWGIGCGTTNVPGVYVNVASYVPWIQTTVNS